MWFMVCPACKKVVQDRGDGQPVPHMHNGQPCNLPTSRETRA
jgi:hypothetical protein